MKNAIKKLTAAVMAFTLLGFGTVVTKTVAPQSDNTITAHAGPVPQDRCSHNEKYEYFGTYQGKSAVFCSACGKFRRFESRYQVDHVRFH